MDGTAAEVLRLLADPEAAGTPALTVATHRPSLDDVFRSLTGGRAAGAGGMSGQSSRTDLLVDCRVLIGRCLLRSRRDPEAFFAALMLPVVLMLLFVYVFGGALRTGGECVDYVVPGLIVLCAGFGAGTIAVAVAGDMGNGSSPGSALQRGDPGRLGGGRVLAVPAPDGRLIRGRPGALRSVSVRTVITAAGLRLRALRSPLGACIM